MILVQINLNSFGQEDKALKSHFELETNYVGRFALLAFGSSVNGGVRSSMYPSVNVADQLNGSGFNIGLKYISKYGWGAKYSVTFRYDHIYYTTKILDSTRKYDQGINVQGLIVDYHFSLLKRIRSAKKYKGEIELGYSLLNTGTGFSVSEYVMTGIGGVTMITDKDFRFDSWSLHYSMLFDEFKVSLGTYIGKSSAYDGENGTYIFPEIRIGYSIPALKKMRKNL